MSGIPSTQDILNNKIDLDNYTDVLNGTNTVTMRLGLMVFSVSQAIQSLLVLNPTGDWVTSTAYALKDLAVESNIVYITTEAHTSGVFATDLAAGKWAVYQIDLNNPSFPGGLTVDTDTLFVDALNNRVGIGTVTPGFALDVVNKANFRNDVVVLGKQIIGAATDVVGDTDKLLLSVNNATTGTQTLTLEQLGAGDISMGLRTPDKQFKLGIDNSVTGDPFVLSVATSFSPLTDFIRANHKKTFVDLDTTPVEILPISSSTYITFITFTNVDTDVMSFILSVGKESGVATQGTASSPSPFGTLTTVNPNQFTITGLGDGRTYTFDISSGNGQLTLKSDALEVGNTEVSYIMMRA